MFTTSILSKQDIPSEWLSLKHLEVLLFLLVEHMSLFAKLYASSCLVFENKAFLFFLTGLQLSLKESNSSIVWLSLSFEADLQFCSWVYWDVIYNLCSKLAKYLYLFNNLGINGVLGFWGFGVLGERGDCLTSCLGKLGETSSFPGCSNLPRGHWHTALKLVFVNAGGVPSLIFLTIKFIFLYKI